MKKLLLKMIFSKPACLSGGGSTGFEKMAGEMRDFAGQTHCMNLPVCYAFMTSEIYAKLA